MSSPLLLVVKLASLLLMRRHLCHCCNDDCRSHHNGIVDAQASLLLSSLLHCPHRLSLSWPHCPCHNGVVVYHCCDCNGCPHDNCVVAVVNAQVSLPLLRWRCCPHNNGIVALDPRWCCCPCCDGIIAILKLGLLPSLQWHCCHHQCCCPCFLLSSWHSYR
jgi:hypothetical protein